jgi:hypothetical protein
MADVVRVRVETNTNALRREVYTAGRRRVNEVAREIEREAKRIVPVRTGHTRSTIQAHPARITGPWNVSASVSAGGAAKFITKGTRPHIIRARRAAALHFFWRKAGRDVFFKSVHHPGTIAYPFMDIAAARVAARNRGRR